MLLHPLGADLGTVEEETCRGGIAWRKEHEDRRIDNKRRAQKPHGGQSGRYWFCHQSEEAENVHETSMGHFNLSVVKKQNFTITWVLGEG